MSSTRSVSEIRNLLQGLIFACPMGEVRADCVIGTIRNLPPDERLRWVNELSNRECLELFLKHRDCLIRCETELGLREAD